MLQFTRRICLFLVPRLSTTEYKLYPTLVTNRFTDSPITIHDELGPHHDHIATSLLLNGISISLRLNRRQFQPIWALWLYYGEIFECYLGGLFPTFLAFSVNRCVIFPSPPLSHLGLDWAWV